jgi:hypothetical protein
MGAREALDEAAMLSRGLPDSLAQMRCRRLAMAGMQVQSSMRLHSTDDQMTALLYSQVGLEE